MLSHLFQKMFMKVITSRWLVKSNAICLNFFPFVSLLWNAIGLNLLNCVRARLCLHVCTCTHIQVYCVHICGHFLAREINKTNFRIFQILKLHSYQQSQIAALIFEIRTGSTSGMSQMPFVSYADIFIWLLLGFLFTACTLDAT